MKPLDVDRILALNSLRRLIIFVFIVAVIIAINIFIIYLIVKHFSGKNKTPYKRNPYNYRSGNDYDEIEEIGREYDAPDYHMPEEYLYSKKNDGSDVRTEKE